MSKSRQAKAHARRHFDKATLTVLRVMILAGVVVAASAPIAHLPLLWLGLLIVAPCLMAVQWYEGDLKDLPPDSPLSNDSAFSDAVSAEVLGLLPASFTVEQLVTALTKTPGGTFFAGRFMLPLDAFGQQSKSVDGIWQEAKRLALKLNLREVDAACLSAAVILTSPLCDELLPHLKLARDDVENGVSWYEHLHQTLARFSQKDSFGGIGRDLSFGYSPLLDQLGYNITQDIQRGGLLRRELEGRQQLLNSMLQLLSSSGRQNIALVGDVGSGRSTLVNVFAERLLTDKGLPENLRYRQVISLDASVLISRAHSRGELEALVLRLFNEAVRAKNIILYLDEAQLFLEEGTGSIDLTNILLPVLEGGRVRLILSLTESWWQRLAQRNSSVTQLFNRITVQPLDREDTLRVMEDQILLLEHQFKVGYTYQALVRAYDLAARFVQDGAFPGKAISVLEAAATNSDDGLVTGTAVEQAIEKRYGVKVQTASQSEDRDRLLNMEELIHQRMINQSRAVKVVSDALRRARAGVRNPSRPIGTFLFLGPTGVGKTELSKALAAVYFNGEDQLVRVDLNEFGEAADASRLLETAAANPQSLCAQISKQPFSVVLLDEIEKAHPNVLNVLLQLLDEGILRDSAGREVNFREAIIIATSNAGADSIRQHISNGEQIETLDDVLTKELIETHAFKPEFLNRFDEIVLFRPLSEEELLKVVDLLLAQINETLSSQKVQVVLTDAAKRWLAKTGYDPQLGARPLRRVVTRTVENVVAQKLLSGAVTPGSTVTLDEPDLSAT